MSLLSQKDRQLALKALEYYGSFIKNPDDKFELDALTNWIKLEIFKHADSTVVLCGDETVEMDTGGQ